MRESSRFPWAQVLRQLSSVAILLATAVSMRGQAPADIFLSMSAEGGRPTSRLIAASDGNLYGTARTGGQYGQGSVFRLDSNGAFTTLFSFNGNNGMTPAAELVEGSDGYLYGMTQFGGFRGTTNGGTIFRLALDGSDFETLYGFNGSSPTDGAYPAAGLIEAGGYFYGTTQFGGANQGGTIFRLDVSGYPTIDVQFLHSFVTGDSPVSTLVESGGFLYGTTLSGGQQQFGTIFRYSIAGGQVETLHHFADSSAAYPHAGLTLANGVLYGTTQQLCFGASLACGSVFRILPDGTGFEVIHYFNAGDGFGSPVTPVIVGSDGALYGTASAGGAHGDGVVYRIDIGTNPPVVSSIHDFELMTSGSRPESGLAEAGGFLYGAASAGGPGGAGTIYRVPIGNGGGAMVLETFGEIPPNQPATALLRSNGVWYGTSNRGGWEDSGTIFRLNGSSIERLHSFRFATSGFAPSHVIAGTTGHLYGVAQQGGPLQGGVVFRINPDGSGFTVIHEFDGVQQVNGALPYGGVVETAGRLYGTTLFGGAHGAGIVYSMALDGSDYRVLHAFNAADPAAGGTPQAGLILASDGLIYGTTYTGGLHDNGTAFRMSPAGGGFEVIHHFEQSSATNGGNPVASLLEGEPGVFYGTTTTGGLLPGGVLSSGGGTVFKLDMRGAAPAFALLKSFEECCIDAPVGSRPGAALVEGAGGWMYGTTTSGGVGGYGTLFGIDPYGAFVLLHSFNAANGANPQAAVGIDFDGSIYGTTVGGGVSFAGGIFYVSLDTDGDGVLQAADNCPITPNPTQLDTNGDGVGDACPRAPNLVVSAASIDFGARTIGTTSPVTPLMLTNTGTLALNMSSIAVSGSAFNGMSMCPPTLAPGASCAVNLTFAPILPGPQHGEVSILSNHPAGPLTVTLLGLGLGIPRIELSPRSLEFAYQPIGTVSAPQRLTLTNTGNGDLSISSIASSNTQFGIVSDCPRTLSPGGSCGIDVDLRPTQPVPIHTGLLAVVSNAAGNPHTVALTGFGDRRELTVTPPLLNMGSRPVGAVSAPQMVTVTNTGTMPVTLNGISLAPGETPGFIDTIAGGPSAVSTADDIPAVEARLAGGVTGMTVDVAGNLYLIEGHVPSRIRRIDVVTRLISTVYTSTALITGIALDRQGNLYASEQISGSNNHQILKIQLSTGTPTVMGGGPTGIPAGDGGPATAAVVRADAVAADASGNVYLTDISGFIRRIDAVTGTITHVAGDLGGGPMQSGVPAVTARLNEPHWIAVDAAGHLVFRDRSFFWRVDADTNILTVISPVIGFAVGQSGGLALDPEGRLYFAQLTLGLVYRAKGMQPSPGSAWYPVVVAGNELALESGDGGPATAARLERPEHIALDHAGNLYIATAFGAIRRVHGAAPPAATQFLLTNQCGATIGVAQSCQIEVRHAGVAGPHRATLLLDDDADGAPQQVTLFGAGMRPIAVVREQFGDQLDTVHFGAQTIGIAGTAQPIRLGNGGTAPLTINAIEIGGNDPAHFVLAASTCAATLNPGEYCTARVGFNPLQEGGRSALLRVLHNADGSPHETPMDGAGLLRALDISPLQLAFGTLNVGTTATQSLTLASTGTSAITIESVSLEGANPADFSRTTGCLQIDAGQSCAIDVGFSPLGAGPRSATVRVVTNAAGSPHLIPLTGAGTASSALSVSPASLDFGPHPLGQLSDPRTITLANIGTAPATIAAPALTGETTTGGMIQSILPVNTLPLGEVNDVALDATGNWYVADTTNHRVVRIDGSTRVASVVAGTGTPGYSGDAGAATAARLLAPWSVAIGTAGELYVSDSGNHVIRRIDSSGIITTVAGNGLAAYAGDGGPASAASLNVPRGIAVDRQGALLIADSINHAIRRVNVTGTITTIAGTGIAGHGQQIGATGTSTALDSPQDVAVDPALNIYVADTGNGRVIRVNRNGIFDTMTPELSTVELPEPIGIAIDAFGNGFVSEAGGDRLYRFSVGDLYPTPFAGDGSPGVADDLPALNGRMRFPAGLAVDQGGNVFVADRENHRIRRITSATLASASEFSTLNHCPSSLPPGQSCTIDVHFTPAARALRTARVSVVESTAAIAYTVDVNGLGSEGFGYTEPVTVVLRTEVGSTITADVPFINSGNHPLSFTGVSGPADLALTHDCPGTLAPNAACRVTVSYSPVTLVNQPDTFAIQHSGAPSPHVVQVLKSAVHASTTTTVTSSANQSVFGEPVTFTAVVASPFGVPTGTIQFRTGIHGFASAPLDASSTAGQTTTTLAAGLHAITAHYSGDSLHRFGASAPLSHVVDRQPTATSVAAVTTPLTYGQPLTLTAQITSPTNGPTTGMVEFFDGPTRLGQASIDRGSASLTLQPLAVGAHQLHAGYAGDSNSLPSASGTQAITIVRATTTTTLAVSPATVYVNQPATFTATVVPQFGGTATGSVVFRNHNNVLATVPLVNGQATLLHTFPSLQWINVRAHYAGDANVSGSTSPSIAQTVSRVPVSLTIESSANPSYAGESVTFTILASTPFGAVPDGTMVRVWGGGMSMATLSFSGGIATVTTSSLWLAPNGLSIQAFTTGDGTYSAASTTFTQRVLRRTSTTTLTSSRNPAEYGQSITFEANVSSAGGPPPDGEPVRFYSGGSWLGAANTVGGTARLTVSNLAVATHQIRADYAGTTFQPSSSAVLAQVVTVASTITTLTSSQNPVTRAHPVTFTVTVTSPGGVTPSGSVTLTRGTTVIGTRLLVNGSASVTMPTNSLPAGSYTIRATYAAQGNYAGSTATITQVIQ